MSIYRVSGAGLLRLAVMAASNPESDFDTILAIVRGADPEEPDVAVDDTDTDEHGAGIDDPGPADPAPADVTVKPVKPE